MHRPRRTIGWYTANALAWLYLSIAIFIPTLCEIASPIPDASHLNFAEGRLVLQPVGHRGDELTGLFKNGKLTLFACNSSWFGFRECLWKADLRHLVGKKTQIWSYTHWLMPFWSEQRVVRLVVAGQEVITDATTRQDRNRQLMLYLGASALLSLGTLLLQKMADHLVEQYHSNKKENS